MKWQRRVLLVSAPNDHDAALIKQRQILARWRVASAARDLSPIEVVGDDVAGATDTAKALRKNYRISGNGFTAILIGKDGGEKLRSANPISMTLLKETIDAMPMRRAGER